MRRSPTGFLAALTVAALVATACGSGATTSADADAPTPATAQTTSNDATAAAPNELAGTFPTLAGGQFDLGSLEGQDAVLWFWAPW